MSEPIRYEEVCNDWNGEYAGLAPTKDGDWVKWEDYARLKSEVERLKGIILAQSSDFVRNATKQNEEPLPDGWNSGVAKACDLLAEKEKEIALIKAEVERLTIQGGDSEPRFVLLSEYRHLKGLLAFATTKYCRLESEVERLRKAGDAMADELIQEYGREVCLKFGWFKEWTAAKEGKPSV